MHKESTTNPAFVKWVGSVFLVVFVSVDKEIIQGKTFQTLQVG